MALTLSMTAKLRLITKKIDAFHHSGDYISSKIIHIRASIFSILRQCPVWDQASVMNRVPFVRILRKRQDIGHSEFHFHDSPMIKQKFRFEGEKKKGRKKGRKKERYFGSDILSSHGMRNANRTTSKVFLC